MALGWEYLTPARFQKGLELGRPAPIPPEWPLLPAKEHHRHTATQRQPALRPGGLSRVPPVTEDTSCSEPRAFPRVRVEQPPCPLGINCQLGLCCYVVLSEVPRLSEGLVVHGGPLRRGQGLEGLALPSVLSCALRGFAPGSGVGGYFGAFSRFCTLLLKQAIAFHSASVGPPVKWG